MGYILAKQSPLNGVKRNLYYVVESYRDNGKIRRRTLLNLGEAQDTSQALVSINLERKRLTEEIEKDREKIAHPKMDYYGRPFTKPFVQDLAKNRNKLKELGIYEEKVKEMQAMYKL